MSLIQNKKQNINQFHYINLHFVCLCNNTIVDSNSDHSQVLRIDCDTPKTTQQKIEQTTEYDVMTETSSYATNSPITTITYPQTTDSLHSTTKRTKEDTICNDQGAGNIIGINVMNRDYNVESDQK
jgi:hypothetical protein